MENSNLLELDEDDFEALFSNTSTFTSIKAADVIKHSAGKNMLSLAAINEKIKANLMKNPPPSCLYSLDRRLQFIPEADKDFSNPFDAVADEELWKLHI